MIIENDAKFVQIINSDNFSSLFFAVSEAAKGPDLRNVLSGFVKRILELESDS